MIWDIILSNLIEASVELEELRDRILACLKPDAEEARRDFIEFSFFVSMEHAYHHVNFAWNCRHQDRERAIQCAREDYKSWEKFPLEFKDLWLSPSRCRGKAREVHRGRMYLTLPRINLDEAIFTIDGMCDGIFRLLGRNIPKHLCRRRLPKSVKPITEGEFSERMRHLYICMNRAWNERKVNLAGDIASSMSVVRRHSCFPRAFINLRPTCKK